MKRTEAMGPDQRKTAQVKVAYMRELNGAISRHIDAHKCGLKPTTNLYTLLSALAKVSTDLGKTFGHNGKD